MNWRVFHRGKTDSTNLDALAGVHGDVFTAAYQTAGRGRLDHKWMSAPGANLLMSAVLSVEGIDPAEAATFPLVAGLAVCRALGGRGVDTGLKWPNDVLVGGRKIAGILCRLNGENVIAGIGINVGETDFPPEIEARATSLALLSAARPGGDDVTAVRDEVLAELAALYALWRRDGFKGVYPAVREIDLLRGRTLSVVQTDDAVDPVRGVSGGILPDGSLEVGGSAVYAGEAHVEDIA